MSEESGQPVDSVDQGIRPESLTVDVALGMSYTNLLGDCHSLGSPCEHIEPLDEGIFEYSESQDYLLPYLRAIKEVADLYHEEYRCKKYTDDSWQLKAFTYLDQAGKHLNVLINFLESAPENRQLATNTLGAVLRAGKRYAELLGPVMVSFGVIVILGWTDTRLHRRHLKTLRVDLEEVDEHLKHLELNLPLVAELLDQAGHKLENMLQHRCQPDLFNRHSKALDELLCKMNTEFNVAKYRLERVDKLIVRLDAKLQTYRKDSLVQYGIVMVAGSGLSWLLRSKEILDTKTMVVLMASTTAPLLYFHFYLSVDIQDMLTEIRKRERRQVKFKLELSALHSRLKLLKANRTQSPQQERATVEEFALRKS